MLSDAEAAGIHEQLSIFRHLATNHSNALHNLLAKHEKLLTDYRALLGDYEEAKESRDRYKNQTRSLGSPFVVVLIDGEAHPFDETLVAQSPPLNGGLIAAESCHASLSDYVRRLGLPPETRIVLRYYVNLAGASTDLHRLQVLGSHSRALAPFAATFSKRYGLFDVIDVGEKPGAVEEKIKENFRLYIDNPSCRHIFFGACTSASNLALFNSYQSQPGRITLIKNARTLPHFFSLGLHATELKGAFYDGSLRHFPPPVKRAPLEPRLNPYPAPTGPDEVSNDGHGPGERPVATQSEAKSSSSHVASADVVLLRKPTQGIDSEEKVRSSAWPEFENRKKAQICTHNLRGACRYGRNCAKSHETPPSRGDLLGATSKRPQQTESRAHFSGDWRRPQHQTQSQDLKRERSSIRAWQVPEQHSFPVPPNKQPPESIEGTPRQPPSSPTDPLIPPQAHRGASTYFDPLQKPPDPTKSIPINITGHRLDIFPGDLDPGDETSLSALRQLAPPCVSHHLLGTCDRDDRCRSDHGYLPERLHIVMIHQMHRRPCNRGGKCRDTACLRGHVCWDRTCLEQGKVGCYLPDSAHNVDPVIARWVGEGEDPIWEGTLLGTTFEDDEDQKQPTTSKTTTSSSEKRQSKRVHHKENSDPNRLSPPTEEAGEQSNSDLGAPEQDVDEMLLLGSPTATIEALPTSHIEPSEAIFTPQVEPIDDQASIAIAEDQEPLDSAGSPAPSSPSSLRPAAIPFVPGLTAGTQAYWAASPSPVREQDGVSPGEGDRHADDQEEDHEDEDKENAARAEEEHRVREAVEWKERQALAELVYRGY